MITAAIVTAIFFAPSIVVGVILWSHRKPNVAAADWTRCTRCNQPSSYDYPTGYIHDDRAMTIVLCVEARCTEHAGINA